MTRAVTDQTFGAVVLQSAKAVVVECWAQWCGPCRQLAPVLDAIATEHADKIDVVTVNVDENPETVQRYGIMLVRTMAVFSGGQLARQVIGARSKTALLRDFADFL